MQDLATERDHLVLAERHIGEGEDRVARQADLLERLRGTRRSGQDVASAETLLGNLRQTLESWKDHRDTILATIARLETEREDPQQLG